MTIEEYEEWRKLILEAKEMGMTPDEVREILEQLQLKQT